MENNRFITWPMLAGITMMLLLLVAEFLTHVLGNVAYVAICVITLWFTQGRKQIILITVIATVLLIVGYILAIPISEPADQVTFFVNRVSAVVVIWFACFFTIRYQKALADESRQRLEIEERKIGEARLRSSQEMHQAIARNFPEGWIGILDEDLKYIFANGRGLKQAGIKQADLIGQRFGKILGVDVEIFLERAKQCNHIAFDVEYNKRNYEVNIGPFLSNLKIKRLLVVVHDITTKKETEIRLTKALARERELNELKSRFVTMASHEFRTPLTTIQSSATLLGKYSGDAYEKEKGTHVMKIKNSVKSLTEILSDFLSFEKLEKESLASSNEIIHLRNFLDKVMVEAEVIKRDNQRLEIKYDGKDDITTDRKFLKSIIYNLLSNAFKYSGEDDTVIVQVEIVNGLLTISVIDHGLGIPQEEHQYVFDRFFRANNVVNIHGTGLGLTIVKKYVDLLGGTLSFTSTMGEKTIFTVQLPIGHTPVLKDH